MAERIADVGQNIALYRAHLDEIDEQDVNARVMPPEMLDRLAENIRKEGRLEQLPFAVLRRKGEGEAARVRFELISGHHRTRAARMAGITELHILVDERDLSKGQVRAKQIAHNSISGKDDLQTLHRLFEDLESVDDILESYLTADDFDDVRQLDPVKIANLSVDLAYRSLSLVFLPQAVADLDALERFVKKLPKDSDTLGVVSAETFDAFRAAVLKVSKKDNVRAMGSVVARMLELLRPILPDDPAEEPAHKATSPNTPNEPKDA